MSHRLIECVMYNSFCQPTAWSYGPSPRRLNDSPIDFWIFLDDPFVNSLFTVCSLYPSLSLISDQFLDNMCDQWQKNSRSSDSSSWIVLHEYHCTRSQQSAHVPVPTPSRTIRHLFRQTGVVRGGRLLLDLRVVKSSMRHGGRHWRHHLLGFKMIYIKVYMGVS